MASNKLLTAALALLAACGAQSDEPTDAPSGTSTDTSADTVAGPTVEVVGDTVFLELPLGRSADNGELSVTFDAVTADSRCPKDVRCVWEGNAGIRLTLSNDDDTDVVIVNSALEPRLVSFVGYTIAYRDLTPYPVSQAPTDRADYVATIAVVDTR